MQGAWFVSSWTAHAVVTVVGFPPADGSSSVDGLYVYFFSMITAFLYCMTIKGGEGQSNTTVLLCLTDLHLLLLYKHFGMEHLKFKKYCMTLVG